MKKEKKAASVEKPESHEKETHVKEHKPKVRVALEAKLQPRG